ncbi:hypothetical protein AAFF_G00327240 [Aldrovandia affinis]|uniref:Uncharacterized protein n=1 Tax=Aldrovandia affinis TaxID=143900 RepID=A0AAD7X0S9_9TELE|nr:hypothetical protein AAFF_G00327240 [Aldrovandia affinis]
MRIQFRNIAPGHNIQQWRKFLCSPSNKASLIGFLVEEWKGPKQREKLKDKALYVTCEQLCFKITKEQWEEATELKQFSFSHRKKLTPAYYSRLFMQQNPATSLLSSLLRIQTS